MWITIGVCCLQSPKREEWKLEKENKRLTFLLSSNIYTTYVTGHQSGEVRDGTRRPTTVCQFSTCRRSRVVLYTFKNIFGVIILERGILLLTLLLPVYLSCLRVDVTRHKLSPLLTTITDQVYGTFMLNIWLHSRLLQLLMHKRK